MTYIRKQAIYDTVVKHLITQDEPAFLPVAGACRYRMTNDGRPISCAVGCLIKDTEYSEAMEGNSVSQLTRQAKLPQHLRPHTVLLSHLQNLHDETMVKETRFGPECIKAARQIATDYDLSDAVIMAHAKP